MHRIYLVGKHEILSMLNKPSFWVMTFLLPGFVLTLNIGTQIFANRAFGNENPLLETGNTVELPVGYVDQANLIHEIPPAIPPGYFRSFASEDDARQASRIGEIDRYFLIPSDFLQGGNLVLVDRNFSPVAISGEQIISYVIAYNLTHDENLATLLIDPLPRIERQALAPHSGSSETNPLASVVPFATLLLFFFLITMSSGFMFQSVVKEKENRTVEVLLVSLRPHELMMGKILGLSVIALFQMAFWIGAGLLALARGRQVLEAAASFQLPPGFVAWALLYFLFGYLLFASMMAALGALAPNAREGGQLSFIIMLPLFAPMFMSNTLMGAPNSSLALILSLFPLTAPASMMTRLATGSVPTWQPAIGLIGLVVTTYFFVLLSARLFKAENLLSTSGLSIKNLVEVLRR